MTVGTNVVKEEAYIIFVEKPEGQISLGRARHRREGNIKINLH